LRITKRRQPAGLTEPEVHGLLRVAGESKRGQAKRNYALLQLLLQTGLRVGELVQLANLLGHESLDTTAIYTQPSGEELAEDLERSRLHVYG
jgi:site-specific recombinase XerD